MGVLSTVVLVSLFVAAGVGYVWYVGQQEPVQEEPAAVTHGAVATPRTEAPKIANNVPTSVAVQMLSSPVAPGENSSITVKTLPEAACTITVEYNKKASTDSGLKRKTADEFGLVSWAWTVDATAPKGSWPVEVTCAKNERSAVVIGDLEVKP